MHVGFFFLSMCFLVIQVPSAYFTWCCTWYIVVMVIKVEPKCSWILPIESLSKGKAYKSYIDNAYIV